MIGRRIPAAAAVGLLALAAGGCVGSSRAFRVDRELAWRAAAGESVTWRPESIDPEKHRVRSIRIGPGGVEVKRELRVERDLNPFARRPSTRVFVKIVQTRPRWRRFRTLEQEFLMSVAVKLTPPASSP